ncbi:hypothetical protein ACX818_001449 [Acinetobacter baumannii]
MKIEYVIERFIYDSYDGIEGRFDNVEDAVMKHIELNNKLNQINNRSDNYSSGDFQFDDGTNYSLIVEYEVNNERQTKPYR